MKASKKVGQIDEREKWEKLRQVLADREQQLAKVEGELQQTVGKYRELRGHEADLNTRIRQIQNSPAIRRRVKEQLKTYGWDVYYKRRGQGWCLIKNDPLLEGHGRWELNYTFATLYQVKEFLDKVKEEHSLETMVLTEIHRG